MGAVIGYARVSTDSQSARDQIVTLKQAGATRVFSEKLSGARSAALELGKGASYLKHEPSGWGGHEKFCRNRQTRAVRENP